MRADQALITRQLAKSRTHAQDLIKEGVVFYDSIQIKKPSQTVQDPAKLIVHKEHIYVSRGANKLLSAINSFSLNFTNKIVADVGASTGGFSEVALLAGALKVYAIDVGHDQLADKIKNDKRVVNLEGINIKNGVILPELVDVAVADLSFISLKLVATQIMNLLNDEGEAIVLIKPQFEVGRIGIGKNGIVKNGEYTKNAILALYQFLLEIKIAVNGFAKSDTIGKDGNQEYFFHLSKKLPSYLSEKELLKKLGEWEL